MDKNSFRQRVPGFIDPRGLDIVKFEFDNLDELVYHSYVQEWLNRRSSFLSKTKKCIMITFIEEGKSYCIGYVKYSDGLDLPIWENPNKASVNKS